MKRDEIWKVPRVQCGATHLVADAIEDSLRPK